jgi:hypothetical protein
MDHSELTLTNILHDPLIRQVLRADRISLPQFAVFLQEAARKHQKSTADACSGGTMPTAFSSRVTGEACTEIATAGRSRRPGELPESGRPAPFARDVDHGTRLTAL